MRVSQGLRAALFFFRAMREAACIIVRTAATLSTEHWVAFFAPRTRRVRIGRLWPRRAVCLCYTHVQPCIA